MIQRGQGGRFSGHNQPCRGVIQRTAGGVIQRGQPTMFTGFIHRTLLSELLRQVLRTRVVVPLEHPQIAVPRDGRQLDQVWQLLGQA